MRSPSSLLALLTLCITGFASAQTGSFTKFGAGCPGTDGTPALSSPDVPTIGKGFTLMLSSGKKSGKCVLVFGATNTNYKGLPLPFDMGILGAKGCKLLVGYSVLVPTNIDATGQAFNTYGIPNLTVLVDVVFYNQYYVLDPKANLLGGVTSNGSISRVGK